MDGVTTQTDFDETVRAFTDAGIIDVLLLSKSAYATVRLRDREELLLIVL